MLRLSFNVRVYWFVILLTCLVATIHAIWDFLPVLMSGEQSVLLKLNGDFLNAIFAYLGKALALVGGITAAARYWIYAEGRLPQRIQDRIEQFQLESDESRKMLLDGLAKRWLLAPAGRLDWTQDRLRDLMIATTQSESEANGATKRIDELKASLSQQSFDKASLHLARGLEFGRLADAGLGADARRHAIDELAKAVDLDGDVQIQKQDLSLHKAYVEFLIKANERDRAIEAAGNWHSVAESKEDMRASAEALVHRGQLVMRSADDAGGVGERNVLLFEARKDFEDAINRLTQIEMPKDALKAEAHERRGDATHELGLVNLPLRSYEAALAIYIECSDIHGIKRVGQKLQDLGANTAAKGEQLHPDRAVAEASLALGEALTNYGTKSDAQAVLFRAKRHCDALLVPDMITSDQKAVLTAQISLAQTLASMS